MDLDDPTANAFERGPHDPRRLTAERPSTSVSTAATIRWPAPWPSYYVIASSWLWVCSPSVPTEPGSSRPPRAHRAEDGVPRVGPAARTAGRRPPRTGLFANSGQSLDRLWSWGPLPECRRGGGLRAGRRDRHTLPGLPLCPGWPDLRRRRRTCMAGSHQLLQPRGHLLIRATGMRSVAFPRLADLDDQVTGDRRRHRRPSPAVAMIRLGMAQLGDVRQQLAGHRRWPPPGRRRRQAGEVDRRPPVEQRGKVEGDLGQKEEPPLLHHGRGRLEATPRRSGPGSSGRRGDGLADHGR